MKKLSTLPLILLALGQPAFADVIPGFTSLPGLGGVPSSSLDYTFDQSGLHGSFTGSSGTGWTLNVSGTGVGAFYTPNHSAEYTVNNSTYALNATFSAQGAFQGGSVTINGTLSGYPAGVTAPTTGEALYAANLYNFGYSAAQAAIGFDTTFTASWANQPVFTGGSAGDVLYLFNQGGVSTGSGALSGLINEFVTGNFKALTISNNFESLAAVPLPMPAVLFGTGLTALMGFARKRRNQA